MKTTNKTMNRRTEGGGEGKGRGEEEGRRASILRRRLNIEASGNDKRETPGRGTLGEHEFQYT